MNGESEGSKRSKTSVAKPSERSQVSVAKRSERNEAKRCEASEWSERCKQTNVASDQVASLKRDVSD